VRSPKMRTACWRRRRRKATPDPRPGAETPTIDMRPERLHIICERYVGSSSLVQQDIAQIPWAKAERRVPIAYFGPGCCYWRAKGHAGSGTVWEYYFEPLDQGHAATAMGDTA
jgi:hypothetical protein